MYSAGSLGSFYDASEKAKTCSYHQTLSLNGVLLSALETENEPEREKQTTERTTERKASNRENHGEKSNQQREPP